ncbi:NucA/NucB deoxyribonuclease domain-containing protein [Streptomyces sp.]|uniref:NucA/NucB deoxyribonuclease domain-containing protein n=1 Tax=Streptomyces sp. TaxID=1931 RepID=UPI002F928CCD
MILLASSVMLLAAAVACGPEGSSDSKGSTPAAADKGAAQTVEPAGRAPQVKLAGAVSLKSVQSCEDVKAALVTYASKGFKHLTCLQKPAKAPSTAPSVAAKAAASAQPMSAGAQCKVTMGLWYFTRFEACGSASLRYDVFDTRTRKTIGGATFTARQEIILQPKSGSWKTDVSLKLDSAWGAAKGLRASWQTACSPAAACGAGTAWSGARAIGVGRTLYGGTSHAWRASQNVQGFKAQTKVTITGVGQILLYPASFEPPGKMTIRCDKIASGTSVGCVFPSFAPTMTLPLKNRGQANVAWSMNYLTDHWGWEGKGRPLTREADESVVKSNRGKVCDSTFKKDPTVPEDSCDEFPFAATNQSGAQLGLTGRNCAEIRPDMPSGGRYTVTYVNNTSGRRCTIGHVPNKENGSVGGSLSTFYQNSRVLNDEKFWLAVR